eukprot:gnl/MRDRNA2_/MRDRNA2_98335_c0_seq1.p1 gnl/MRDRNA2_/MRDRNA2_98335_c0~~gnl/MRDRNA2_/MRDRNA2_98335_c0_seq1.p1  ORF type:complete len:259 (-),score=58.30 gnl/MRDRNA2_/MRDRNA2_98335_c0_seq1:194-970(-)
MEHERFDTGMLPEQHEDQLALGFRIIQNSFKNKVHGLEQETKGFRIANEEQKHMSSGLQRKNSALEVELVESHQRTQQLAEENKELFKTVQQLRKRIGNLDDLKKKLQLSMQDELSSEAGADSTNMYLNDDYLRGSMPATLASMSSDGLMPQRIAQPATSPMMYTYEASPFPQQMHAPAPAPAPVAANQPAVEGKQFFRMARSQLSYEAFNEFLANIKRLNNQQQTRAETLQVARDIFGPQLEHLYFDFEQLLSKQTL